MKMVETMFNFWGNLIDSVHLARVRNKAFMELSSLTDRELSDLGISRWEIAQVVLQTHK